MRESTRVLKHVNLTVTKSHVHLTGWDTKNQQRTPKYIDAILLYSVPCGKFGQTQYVDFRTPQFRLHGRQCCQI